jgi:hypothetical protein
MAKAGKASQAPANSNHGFPMSRPHLHPEGRRGRLPEAILHRHREGEAVQIPAAPLFRWVKVLWMHRKPTFYNRQ